MAQRRQVEHDEAWFEQREREEREKRLEAIRDEKRQKRLADAYIAVAATEAGRIVLSEIVNSEHTETPFTKFTGNSHDAFNIGRGLISVKMKRMLRQILDRETFIAIVEPESEEEECLP